MERDLSVYFNRLRLNTTYFPITFDQVEVNQSKLTWNDESGWLCRWSSEIKMRSRSSIIRLNGFDWIIDFYGGVFIIVTYADYLAGPIEFYIETCLKLTGTPRYSDKFLKREVFHAFNYYFKTLNKLNVFKKVKFQITTLRTYFGCSQPLKTFWGIPVLFRYPVYVYIM